MSKQTILSVVKPAETSPEAPARAALAAAIQARDGIATRLGKVRNALAEEREHWHKMDSMREELLKTAPRDEVSNLVRLEALVDSGKALRDTQEKRNSKAEIERLSTEIEASMTLDDDLGLLIKKLEDELRDGQKAIRAAAGAVFVPTIEAVYNSVAKKQAELTRARSLLRQISFGHSLSPDWTLAVNRVLTDPYPKERQDQDEKFPAWDLALAALESDPAAALPALTVNIE